MKTSWWMVLAAAAPSAFGQSANLRVTALDATAVAGDHQALTIGGAVTVELSNVGGGDTGAGFEVLLFEDADGDGLYQPGVDVVLGVGGAQALAAGATSALAVPVSGPVRFRGNLIWALADSQNVIPESDENDNLRSTGLECSTSSQPGPVLASLEWSWTSSTIEPASLNVGTTPCVVDLDGDGVPDVIFTSTANSGCVPTADGVLRALDGATGAEVFTVTDPALRVQISAGLAVGDLDGDGRPEIVAVDSSNARLICFRHDGSFLWRSGQLEPINWGAPSIADLDGDGVAEIVVGRQALSASGVLLWTGAGGRGSQNAFGLAGPMSCVTDIDGDGSPNVIAGNTVYSETGAIVHQNIGLPDAVVAVGNFDADPDGEIVAVAGGVVRLIKLGPGASLTELWSRAIPGGGNGGPPTVADFDGDGLPEIGVAGASRYVVLDHTGAVKWSVVTQDGTSNFTGSSVFDFNGDGAAEVVYRDEVFLRIYDGATGAVLFQTPLSSGTWAEYVLVADVDGDGQAEIVATANANCALGPQRGVFVFGATNGDWVATRKVWNQHTYHITNVNEDGTIPAVESPHWLTPAGRPYNNFRQNVLNPLNPGAAADLTASFLRTDSLSTPPTLTARIGNGGDASVGAGLPVAFYDADPSAGGNLLGVASTTQSLAPGQFQDVTLQVAALPSAPWVVADDAGGGVSTVVECDETNNVHSASTPVILVCPPDFTEVWAGGIPAGQTAPIRTGFASAFSACGQGVSLTHADVSVIPNTPSNPGAPEVVITRRWTLVDGCGASASCDQVITLLSPSGMAGLTTLDFEPGQCPNLAPIQTQGAARIAVTGTWLHSAAAIVPASLTLRRVDRPRASLSLAAFPRSMADTTRPYVGYPGGCSLAGPEGHPDLVLWVPHRALSRLVGVRPGSGAWVELEVRGMRVDGSSFSARDVVLIP